MQTSLLVLCLILLSTVLAADYRKYCWPDAVTYTTNGEHTVSDSGKTPVTSKYIELHKIDRIKIRTRTDDTIVTEGKTIVFNSISYQKTKTLAYSYIREDNHCDCKRVDQLIIVGCATGNATEQAGGMVRLDSQFNYTHDGMQYSGNSSEFVRPLSAKEEALFVSFVAAHTTAKDGKVVSWFTTGEKYVDIVQEVDDSDFEIPKAWNCPTEDKCKRIRGVATVGRDGVARMNE